MSNRIIKYGKWREVVERGIAFYWKDQPTAGFHFDCDEDFNPCFTSIPSQINYEHCCDGTYDVTGPFHETQTRRVWVPAQARCDCGATVYLHRSLTNYCDKCDREYNASGQLLADRSQWGDDTGESVSDILRGNCLMGGDE